MSTKLIFTFFGLAFCSLTIAQVPEPLAAEEEESEYRKDRLAGTLTSWKKAEINQFCKECEAQLKGHVSDPERLCACAQEAVAANLNYSTFTANSAYQKGKIIGFLSKESCFSK
jgi:hypothetical protein